jgi:uncharacterized protein (DUF488 family)
VSTPAEPRDLRLLTVGHSNHDPATLVEMLRREKVAVVADVRSSPFSGRLPQFNRPSLESLLSQNRIAYLYLGDLLGGRPCDDALYDERGRIDYELVRETPAFALGLARLLQAAEAGGVAMLCAEEDPLDCHRALLIAPALVERGVRPLHLRKSGVETTDEMERRLLRETGLERLLEPDLFTPVPDDTERRRVLTEAYRLMGQRKGYRREQPEE